MPRVKVCAMRLWNNLINLMYLLAPHSQIIYIDCAPNNVDQGEITFCLRNVASIVKQNGKYVLYIDRYKP